MEIRDKLLTCLLWLALPLFTHAQLTESEPNNGWSQSDLVAEGSTMSGSTGACSPADNSLDWFKLTATRTGQLKLRTNMSNDGPAAAVSMLLYNTSVSAIQSFSLSAGVNGASALDSIVFDCLGTGTYYLMIDPAASGCLNYSFDYEVVLPVYGADLEPNNNYNSSNTDTVAVNTTADGRINFSQNDDNSDHFVLILDDDGILNVHVDAEHAGSSTDDSLTVRLHDGNNISVIKVWRVAIGANSVPFHSDMQMSCRGNDVRYFLSFSSDVCGTSYRFSYDVFSPVYGADNENNDTYNAANTDTVAVGVDQDGRLDFYYDDNMDYYAIVLNDDGVLNVHVDAEHFSSSTSDSLTVTLHHGSNITVLQTWRVAIGANSTAFSSDMSMNCRGNGERYFLAFTSDACGTSYRFSYDVTSAVFANDTEENDSYNSANTDTVAVGTNQDGRLSFYYDDNSDYYILALNDDGILNIRVQAEQASSATNDSLTVHLRSNGSQTVLKTWRVAIGTNSIPSDSTIRINCRGNEQRYYLQFASDGCGTSYRFNYDVTPPVFSDDTEENDAYTSANTDTVVVATDQDGRLNFYYDDNSDYYILALNDDGILNIHVQAEQTSNSPDDSLTVHLRSNGSQTVLKTWRVAIGANSIPSDSTIRINCRGDEQRYYLQFASDACGTSYRFNYDVTPPVFGDDTEENDSYTSANTDTVVVATDQDGRLNFYYDDNSDYYILALNDDGILNIHVHAEQTSNSSDDSLTVHLRNNGSQTVLKTWRVAIGANSNPSDSTIRMNCRGNEQRYYLQFASDACGTSYRFNYTVTPPLFADDLEDNDSYNSPNTGVIDLSSSAATGRLNFHYDDNSDYYKVILSAPGTITIDSRAENAGNSGTYTLNLYNSNVSYLEAHSFPVGGASTAASGSWTSATRPAGTYYLQATNAPCGTSYSFDCYDDDNDGVCNSNDLCASTPTGEGVNNDGCSCSQVVVDDGDVCTLDECLNGIVTNTFQDADGDLTCDANDGCPNDPNKIAPGTCGCGVPDTDTDGDLTADCNDGCPDDPNKIEPGTCGCGVADTDSDGDLTADCNDGCPNDPDKVAPGNCGCGNPEPGASCDDGNANTSGDVIQANCTCEGTPIGATDCNGIVGGPAQAGTPCDDLNACTVNDVYTGAYPNCDCVGTAVDPDDNDACTIDSCDPILGVTNTPVDPDDGDPCTLDSCDPIAGVSHIFQDADGDLTCDANDGCPNDPNKIAPGNCGCGNPEPGASCDDGNANTSGDVIQANCTCEGTPIGITDCLGIIGGPALPGTACDDNNPNTTNDLWTASCQCEGTPVGACTQNEVVLVIQTDGMSATTWEFVSTTSNITVASGGSQYPGPSTVQENICLADGCYLFRMFDDAGDGITNGGYILRTVAGDRIIDNFRNFHNGSESAISGGPSAFCFPMSTQKPIFVARDKTDWVSNEYFVCEADQAVSDVWLNTSVGNPLRANSGYQFWFFDPNGGFSYRRGRYHSSSDGFGPANQYRACHMRINNWVAANQIPAQRMMNVRVRTRVNGVYGDFGPAYQFMIDPIAAACPATKLNDIPDQQFLSCNSTRQWGGNNYVHAIQKSGANKYQFRFRIAAEGFVVVRSSNTYFLKLNWATNPLEPGKTYEVDARVSKNGGATWCATGPSWGESCTLTIAGGGAAAMAPGISKELEQLQPSVTLWPNPNNGEQLWLSVKSLGTVGDAHGTTSLNVDIHELTGKRVESREIPIAGSDLVTLLDIPELATGVYLVRISAGKLSFTERLVITR